MGLSTTKSLTLAVLGLACMIYCGFAAELDSVEVIHTTLLSYAPADAITQSGGVFTDLTGAPSEVFMWTVNPGDPYVMSWDLGLLYNSSFVDRTALASGSQISGESNAIFRFFTAQTDGQSMYLATTTNIYKVNPADITAVASNITLTDFQQPTTMMFLGNSTSKVLIVGAFGTSDLMTVDLNTFATATKLTLDNAPSQDGATAHAKIADDTGYLIFDTSTSVVLARVALTASSLEPVPVVQLMNVYAPDDAPSFYDSTNNILYLTVNNVTGAVGSEDQPPVILIALNLTVVDDGSNQLYNSTISVSFDSSKRAVTAFGDAVRAVIVSDEAATYPKAAAITVDVAGGQAFVMMSSGVITRVNTDSFEIVTPSVIASSDDANPAGLGMLYKGTLAAGDRTLLAWTKNSIITSTVSSACPSDCGETNTPASGTCVAGVCQCITGRHGADCSGIACTSDCGESLNQGSCGLSGQCQCEPDWTFASNCTARQCTNNCNGNGVCDESTFTCACNSQWAGAACQLAASQACNTFDNEADCVAKTGACGWCMDGKGFCVAGNLNGPVSGSCRAWYSAGKYQVGLLAAAIIFIVIFFLMLFVGIFSAMPMDYVIAGILVESSLLTTDFLKEAYWRDERSSKTWKMFDLFQFISLYAFINVKFPTQLIQFTRYFNWANLMLPMPYGYEDNKSYHGDRIPGNSTTTTTKRNLLNVEQYANSVKLTTEHVFYGTMFWFGMLVAACLVVYGIYAFFMWVFLRKKEPNISTVLLQKLFYILTRLVLIGYMPINFTAAWHIRGGNTPHKGSIAAAVFAIIIFGILPIVFNAIVVWNKGKELLFLYLKLRFGALYSIYHYTKARFNLIVLIRKLAVAWILGFLAAESSMGKTTTIRNTWLYAQVFAIVAVYFLYIIAILAIRPYLDQVHLVLDVAMSTLFAVAFGVAILHRTNTSTAAMVVAGVCIIIVFLACLLAFAHSWWNISGRNTYPWIMCGPKYGGLEEKENHDDEEMDTAQVIKNKKVKEEALAGVMPSNKPGKVVEDKDESSEVDSSLQSSSESEEDEDEEEAAAEEDAQEDEESEESEASEESEESDE